MNAMRAGATDKAQVKQETPVTGCFDDRARIVFLATVRHDIQE